MPASHRLSVAKGHLGSAGRRPPTRGGCRGLRTYYQVIGRLKPGVTIDRARTELATVAERLAASYPRTNKGVGITVAPLFDRVTGPIRSCAAAAARWCHVSLVHCLRERGEPDAGARRGAPGGDCRATRARRRPAATAAADARRERAPRRLPPPPSASSRRPTGPSPASLLLAPRDVPRIDEVGLNVSVLAFAIARGGGNGAQLRLAPALQFWRARRSSRALRVRGAVRARRTHSAVCSSARRPRRR